MICFSLNKFLPLFVVLLSNFSQSEKSYIPDKDLVTLAKDAKWVFGQSISAEGNYLRFEDDILFVSAKERLWLGVGQKEMGYFSQVEEYFIISDKFAPNEIWIYIAGKLKNRVPIEGISFLCSADFDGTQILLIGLNDEQTQYSLKVINLDGTLASQTILDVKDVTSLNDKSISYTVFDEQRWIIWLPANLEVIFMDKKSKEKKIVSIKMPIEWYEIDQRPFRLLKEEDLVKRYEQCEELLGTQVHSLPAAFFKNKDSIFLCYWQYYLNGCGRITRKEGPPFETGCRTSIAKVSIDKPGELKTVILEDELILGYSGTDRLVSQKQSQNESAPWYFTFRFIGNDL